MFARSQHAAQNRWGTARHQCLNAGVLDAVRVSLVPYLIGEGVPYFAELGATPIKLAQPKVVEGRGVTHLYYEVER